MYLAGADTSATVDKECAGITVEEINQPESRSLQRLTAVAGGQLLATKKAKQDCPSLLFKKQLTVFLLVETETVNIYARRRENHEKEPV